MVRSQQQKIGKSKQVAFVPRSSNFFNLIETRAKFNISILFFFLLFVHRVVEIIFSLPALLASVFFTTNRRRRRTTYRSNSTRTNVL